MVLESSLPLYATFFDTHPELEPTEGWPERDFFMFREEDIKWFEEPGCKWKKVEASPGDLILWDRPVCTLRCSCQRRDAQGCHL